MVQSPMNDGDNGDDNGGDAKMTLDQIADILMEIRSDIRVMKRDLGEDYKQLHGNGQPGLIAKHQDIELRVTALEHTLQELKEAKQSRTMIIGNVIGHIVAIGAALLSFFARR